MNQGERITSLAEIMNEQRDEQLAHKLHAEEQAKVQTAQDIDFSKMSENEQLQYVLNLSMNSNPSTVKEDQDMLNDNALASALNSDPNEDESLALALRLQEEENAAMKRQEESVRTHQYSKVSLAIKPAKYTVQEEPEDDEDLDDYDEYLDEYVGENLKKLRKPQGRLKHDSEIWGKIHANRLERYGHDNMSQYKISGRVFNQLNYDVGRMNAHKTRVRGNRTDKSTSQQVLDQKTRVNLLQLLNAGYLSEMHGCVSTGKEANVYHGAQHELKKMTTSYSDDDLSARNSEFEETTDEEEHSDSTEDVDISALDADEGRGIEVAIKIFRTTLNEFKNRLEYGDRKFNYDKRRGVAGETEVYGVRAPNNRNLIKAWADKEFRNLSRLQHHGVPCPMPLIVRENILIMEFIGDGGLPAPCLKDAVKGMNKSSSKFKKKLNDYYSQIVHLMRIMYRHARLIHADLSEYNLLVHEDQVYVIDVSQAVKHEHPRCLEYLRKDCKAVTDFFTHNGIEIPSIRQLFNFITDLNDHRSVSTMIAESEKSRELKTDDSTTSVPTHHDDEVFMKARIPRFVSHVPSYEACHALQSEKFHKDLTGIPEENPA